VARISSSSLSWIAAVSRFWVFWMMNTIRKVTMVVEVLTRSCQVSLKPKNGPDSPHSTMIASAATKIVGRPASNAMRRAIEENLKPLLFMEPS
jgi:hypothetical protein